MPTLPLYVLPPGGPNAWHRVTAPGGYEIWRFEAEAAAGGVRLAAEFRQGCPHDPCYMDRYARYIRRPTRNAPPLPAEYPCASLTIWDDRSVLAQLEIGPDGGSFSASPDRPEVTLGPNFARLEPGGAYRLHFETADAAQNAAVDLLFTPTLPHPPYELTHLSRQLTGAEHRWIIAAAHCAVSGKLTVGGQIAREIAFDGVGCHDHEYGTGIRAGTTTRRWVMGRVLFPDGATLFSRVVPDDVTMRPEDHIIDVGPDGVAEREGEIINDASPWKRFYPEAFRVGKDLALSHPTVSPPPADFRVTYDVAAGERRGIAHCRINSDGRGAADGAPRQQHL